MCVCTYTYIMYSSDLLKIYTPSRQLWIVWASADRTLYKMCISSASTKLDSQHSFSFIASTLWNTLSKEIRFSQSFSFFKSALRTHLLQHDYDWCVCECFDVFGEDSVGPRLRLRIYTYYLIKEKARHMVFALLSFLCLTWVFRIPFFSHSVHLFVLMTWSDAWIIAVCFVFSAMHNFTYFWVCFTSHCEGVNFEWPLAVVDLWRYKCTNKWNGWHDVGTKWYRHPVLM